jgi:hypothetical protein
VLTDTVRNPRARLALGAVLVTTIGITATAPGITSAQDSIQTGNRLIEEQTAAIDAEPAPPMSDPPAAPVGTAPPTSTRNRRRHRPRHRRPRLRTEPTSATGYRARSLPARS